MEIEENEEVTVVDVPVGEPEIIAPVDVPVVVVNPEPTPESATIAQLVETIAAVSESILQLRLQIETERLNNIDMLLERLNQIDEKIDGLKTVESTEIIDDEPIVSPEPDSEPKRARRWL